MSPAADLLGRGTLLEQFAKRLVAQYEAESRENCQVAGYGRAHEHEEGVHWLAIHRAEIDRVAKQSESHERLLDVQHDRVAHVRDRDSITDAGGSHRLARLENVHEECTILIRRKRQSLDELAEHCVLVGAWDVVKDAAGSQQVAEAWNPFR